jgi:hypothetical protein
MAAERIDEEDRRGRHECCNATARALGFIKDAFDREQADRTPTVNSDPQFPQLRQSDSAAKVRVAILLATYSLLFSRRGESPTRPVTLLTNRVPSASRVSGKRRASSATATPGQSETRASSVERYHG